MSLRARFSNLPPRGIGISASESESGESSTASLSAEVAVDVDVDSGYGGTDEVDAWWDKVGRVCGGRWYC